MPFFLSGIHCSLTLVKKPLFLKQHVFIWTFDPQVGIQLSHCTARQALILSQSNRFPSLADVFLSFFSILLSYEPSHFEHLQTYTARPLLHFRGPSMVYILYFTACTIMYTEISARSFPCADPIPFILHIFGSFFTPCLSDWLLKSFPAFQRSPHFHPLRTVQTYSMVVQPLLYDVFALVYFFK